MITWWVFNKNYLKLKIHYTHWLIIKIYKEILTVNRGVAFTNACNGHDDHNVEEMQVEPTAVNIG